MTMVPAASTRERFLPLDLARGVAALLVALFHFQEYGWLKFNNTAPALAVPFFFLLSGFVLSHSYGCAIAQQEMTLRSFTRARLARLWPLHMATMLVMIVLWTVIENFSKTGIGVASVLRADHFTPLQIFEALTLTHELLGGRHGLNVPSWSISVEFWCGFLVFALLACRSSLVIGFLISLVVVGLMINFVGRPLSWPSRAYVAGLGLFAIGWALHNQIERIKSWRDMLPDHVWWTLSLAAIALILIPNWRIEGRQFLFYPIFIVMIATLTHARVSSPVLRKIMERAGDWSYGIYLWHMPIVCVMVAADQLMQMGILNSPAGDAAFIVLTITVSAWSYRNIELPAKNFLRYGPDGRR